ncbi:hypothetical protein Ancab_018987 [Ancistrocladus abbreviatus]
MPFTCLPLRWESTGEQWWYASPIDCAAAYGHYDLVKELLHHDANLLIKLTSLRRIRRLETVWDDESQFNDVAKYRARVAWNLLLDCEINGTGQNSLIRAGYGGWLLYAAASAGDVNFVEDLLERDPLLVFGEGEYGITDILYAAARSMSSEVFTLLLDFAISLKSFPSNEGEVDGELGDNDSGFRWEMMNRAVHAAARGGNLVVLKELLWDSSDVFAYRDSQGSTILHAASGRGRVEVVKELIATYDIIDSADSNGNTALHVAAYRGYLTVVEALTTASPSLVSSKNNEGASFLHLAVAGFQAPGFHRIDQQRELLKQLVSGTITDLQDIINMTDNKGRTALHIAVIENVQFDVVQLLMAITSIDLNIRDVEGMTPLDLLRQQPRTASSQILVKQLVSAGGVSDSQGHATSSAVATNLQIQGIGSSPGTSFRIPDAEIFLHPWNDKASEVASDAATSTELSAYPVEPSHFDSGSEINSSDGKKLRSINSAARRLKALLHWPKRKEKRTSGMRLEDTDSCTFHGIAKNRDDALIPLRQRFSRTSSLPNNKRALPVRCEFPSPLTKKKFAASLMHGVVQAMPKSALSAHVPPSPFSKLSVSSPTSVDKERGVQDKDDAPESSFSTESSNGARSRLKYRQSSFSQKLKSQYFCFGAGGLVVEDSINCRPLKHRETQSGRRLFLEVYDGHTVCGNWNVTLGQNLVIAVCIQMFLKD